MRNRHVLLALLVAPVLAVLGWMAMGMLAGERAAPARPGQDYPLLEKSSCRWASGFCELENEDFALTLRVTADSVLEVRSDHALEGVLVSIHDPAVPEVPAPRSLAPMDAAGMLWGMPIAAPPAPGDRIRLVAAAGGSRYFGEASSRFTQSPDAGSPAPDP